MKKRFAGLLAVAAAAVAGPAAAQERPVSLEIRAGAAFPIQSFGQAYGDLDIGSGYGVSGNVTFHHSPAIWFFAGYSYNRLEARPGTEPASYRGEDAAVDQGFDAGVRLKLFSLPRRVEPYIRAAGVYHRLTLHGTRAEGEDAPGFSLPDSYFSLGFAAGAGAEIGLSPRLSLVAEATLTSYQPRYGERANAALQAEHVRGDAGIRVRL